MIRKITEFLNWVIRQGINLYHGTAYSGAVRIAVIALICLMSQSQTSRGFAVLSHEAVIDACWDHSIVPALQQKFPHGTSEDIHLAKAYAYGGALMPDMGFFPFGSVFFTNLVHYCRSGDFTIALLDEAQNMNEYAFALGALAHYNADNYGHPLGINPSVPLVYVKDQKFGSSVTYANDKIDHRRMEFAFDVLQVVRGNYEQSSYHDFIGFEIAKPVLERAFIKTYGIELGDIFANVDLAISACRLTVRNLFPVLTKAAWMNKKDEIEKQHPDITGKQFRYNLSRKEYNASWTRTSWRVSLVATVIRFTPKVFGNARVLRFKMPTAESEMLFKKCFDSTVFHYQMALTHVSDKDFQLPNLDYDTGKLEKRCEYMLADETYLMLLKKLSNRSTGKVDNSVQENILTFYNQPFSADSSALITLYHKVKKEKHFCSGQMQK